MYKDLSEIQYKLLEMLKWFHKYCTSNDIPYYVIGGTMLGAVRHEGFIPWDDDVDVIVPRPDYDRLCSIMKDVVEHYYIETPFFNNDDYIYGFAKLYDINTTKVERLKHKLVRGVYIDIFPLDGLGNNYEESVKNYKAIDRMHMLLTARTCTPRIERKWWKNASIMVARLIPDFILNDHKLAQSLDKLCSSYGYDNNLFVANCMSTYRAKEIIEKRIFGQPKLYRFEDMEVYGPELYEEYLAHLFSDWRQLPPVNQRKSAHDYIDIDLKKSYREYKEIK